jgi:hypothetical protein
MNVHNKPEFESTFYPAILGIIIANIIATTAAYIAIGCVIYKTIYKKNETSWSVNSLAPRVVIRLREIVDVFVEDKRLDCVLYCIPIQAMFLVISVGISAFFLP